MTSVGTRTRELVPPFDAEIELSVLAELVAPLHRVAVLDTVTASDFYNPRHQRVVAALRAGKPLPADDATTAANAARFAFPLTKDGLATFLDHAARRRRIGELEAERLELYGVAA
jgi:hypothetical protein